MKQRLARQAQQDIATILEWSGEHFGLTGRRRYQYLIDRGLKAILQPDPPPGTRQVGIVAPDLLHFHLRHVRRDPDGATVRRPRHFILYRLSLPDLVVVLRVLHDAMDLPQHVPEGGD